MEKGLTLRVWSDTGGWGFFRLQSVPREIKDLFHPAGSYNIKISSTRQVRTISRSGRLEKREVDGEYLEKTCAVDTV